MSWRCKLGFHCWHFIKTLKIERVNHFDEVELVSVDKYKCCRCGKTSVSTWDEIARDMAG